jgi:hypothetical protein
MDEPIPSPGEYITTYVIVQATHELVTEVYYAYSYEDAVARQKWCMEKTNSDWRIGILIR